MGIIVLNILNKSEAAIQNWQHDHLRNYGLSISYQGVLRAQIEAHASFYLPHQSHGLQTIPDHSHYGL